MGIENKISDERLKELAGDFIMNGFANVGECTEIARELLSLRAQLAGLAKQEPFAYWKPDHFGPVFRQGKGYALTDKRYKPLFEQPVPPAPVVGGRTMPRHEFAQMVNELRDVPAVQSKREKIVSILHAFNINPAGGSVADE